MTATEFESFFFCTTDVARTFRVFYKWG